MSAGYRESAPPARAQQALACVWQRRPQEDVAKRIIPDGCVDLIWSEGGRLIFAGADTGPRVVQLSAGRPSIGVRLWPHAAGAVLGLPASELADQQPDATSVWGANALSLHERLAAASQTERAALLVAAVLARRPAPDPLVAHAARRLDHRAARIADVARDLGVSERSLQRRTLAAVGYGLKTLGRILRLQRLIGLDQQESLAARAWSAGYASQAHMNEEVRRLTGRTPVAFLKDMVPAAT